MELFSALDNVLSQKAEDTLTEFAAVKKADIQLQTQLGNRQGQIAANIIGAFAESQSTAFGWQVRVYGGENDSKGANAGIFFRRVDGESLYGINSFVDYEKGNYGEFLRYGIGGELQNRYAEFAMNYYLPITDDKHTGSTVAFSQKGYDANLRINIPQLDFLKVRADYYHFDGKYGGENDKGFRYGMEVKPIDNLHIGIFYDDGGEKFGGDIVYVYNIAAPQKRESKDAFSPDLFAPIVREYSQRIITATTGPQIQVLRIPTLTTFMTTTIPVMTITNIIGNFVSLTTFMTEAGLTLTTAMTTMMTMESRMASVQITTRVDRQGVYLVATTSVKFLLDLPPDDTPRPWVATITANFNPDILLVIESDFYAIDFPFAFPNVSQPYTMTVVQGSEEFISITTAVSTTTEVETRAPITTEMRMTNAATPSTMEVITPERMITTAMTAFLIRTITIGANTGAAKVDSHLPPSFPLSFPQVPKLALAAPVILARRAGIQNNRVAIIQKPRRQYAQ